MKDEKHIRVPIRHTPPHKSATLFFSLSPAYPTSHCTLWPNMHNPGKDFKKWGRERETAASQPDRRAEWGFQRHPSPPSPSALGIAPELWGSDDPYQGLDYHLSEWCHRAAGHRLAETSHCTGLPVISHLS